MKKLNTTYLDNLVSKILKETLEEKADSLVSKIKGNVCECGGTMYEGECEECGYKGEMEEGIYDVDKTLDDKFDYVTNNESTNEDKKKTCLYHIENFKKGDPIIKEMCQGVNINEALKGRQRKLDRNKNNKIDAEDFKMLRKGKKSETDEGNAFTGALSKARKTGEDDFEVDGKKFETKEDKIRDLTNNKNTHKGVRFGKKVKESYSLTETEMISLIEKIVNEEKDKTNIKVVGGSPKGLEKYKQIHAKDGKENDDNIKAVAKKMKEYLKDGSKGDYDMNPKMFPKGNGELEKMKKKAYEVSKDGEEFIDDYLRPGMQTLDYDEMHPNEEWMNDNIEGSSRTGNNPDWANTGESDVNKNLNKTRKKGAYTKAKRAAYNKAPQPVISDKPGQESGKGLNIKTESIDKKQKQINEEFDRMKSLIGYDRKTQ
jgi:hypothetical protein